MVESEQDAVTGDWRIVLKPNASLTGRQAGWLLAGVGVVMANIAMGFAFLGLWPVLPFYGAEWLFLAYCFRLAFRANARREVITITEATVLVEKGRDRPEETYRFQRAWVAPSWTPAPIPGHPGRLCLRLHGKDIEIGRFLVETERAALARELRQILCK